MWKLKENIKYISDRILKENRQYIIGFKKNVYCPILSLETIKCLFDWEMLNNYNNQIFRKIWSETSKRTTWNNLLWRGNISPFKTNMKETH